MKARYIFTAVIAVSIIMGLLLPRLSHPAVGSAAPASASVVTEAPPPATEQAAVQAPAVAQAPAMVAVAAARALLATQPPVVTEPAVVTNPPPPQPDTVASSAAEAPAFVPPAQGQPTPTPLVSRPSVMPLTAAHLPEMQQLAASLANNNAQQVTGVYVPGLLAARVVTQPNGDETYVSVEDGTLTQYATPSRFGSIGLLAHNYLTGKAFFQLKPGQQIGLIYGDGHIDFYKVSGIQAFQALSPHDVRSDFVDLSDPQGSVLTYHQVFERVYTTAGQLVFQTCIEANGEISWGRIFVMADPIGKPEIQE